MPQFLRAIRILCPLYKVFMETSPPHTPMHFLSSLPGSPAFPSDGGNRAANVRRTGSFGSILDTPLPNTERSGKSVLRFGHRRSHSNTQNQPRTSPTEAKANLFVKKRKESSISDPFEQLETVWESLECWFDLVKAEVERQQKQYECEEYEVRVKVKIVSTHKVQL